MGEAGQRNRLFGTDGVRGVAGRELNARLAMDLGAASAAVLGRPAGITGRPVAVVGRDPRLSGEFLGRGGVKRPDAVEDDIEAELASGGTGPGRGTGPGHGTEFGRVSDGSTE